ncbi:MAG: hypothetical protein U0872_05310 [Planctomycetaceae bacterium]
MKAALTAQSDLLQIVAALGPAGGSRACWTAGRQCDQIAMIAMTTSNSIKVNRLFSAMQV